MASLLMCIVWHGESKKLLFINFNEEEGMKMKVMEKTKNLKNQFDSRQMSENYIVFIEICFPPKSLLIQIVHHF